MDFAILTCAPCIPGLVCRDNDDHVAWFEAPALASNNDAPQHVGIRDLEHEGTDSQSGNEAAPILGSSEGDVSRAAGFPQPPAWQYAISFQRKSYSCHFLCLKAQFAVVHFTIQHFDSKRLTVLQLRSVAKMPQRHIGVG
ncbi:MAG: hypothetical protein EOO23_09080 [Comamonadaceae bacterium]|nr:MAG: hypothetical protein EOO23_09080 [Comamonadaceae bacterium]